MTHDALSASAIRPLDRWFVEETPSPITGEGYSHVGGPMPRVDAERIAEEKHAARPHATIQVWQHPTDVAEVERLRSSVAAKEQHESRSPDGDGQQGQQVHAKDSAPIADAVAATALPRQREAGFESQPTLSTNETKPMARERRPVYASRRTTMDELVLATFDGQTLALLNRQQAVRLVEDIVELFDLQGALSAPAPPEKSDVWKHIDAEGGDSLLALRNIICHLNILLTDEQKAAINWHSQQSVSLAVMRVLSDSNKPVSLRAAAPAPPQGDNIRRIADHILHDHMPADAFTDAAERLARHVLRLSAPAPLQKENHDETKDAEEEALSSVNEGLSIPRTVDSGEVSRLQAVGHDSTVTAAAPAPSAGTRALIHRWRDEASRYREIAIHSSHLGAVEAPAYERGIARGRGLCATELEASSCAVCGNPVHSGSCPSPPGKHAAVSLRAAPPALEELIEAWRAKRNLTDRPRWTVYERCADELETALADVARLQTPHEDTDKLRIEVETLRELLAAWQKRCYEAERTNPHGEPVDPALLEPFIREMREHTIPAIIEAVRERQRMAAEQRHIPLSLAPASPKDAPSETDRTRPALGVDRPVGRCERRPALYKW